MESEDEWPSTACKHIGLTAERLFSARKQRAALASPQAPTPRQLTHRMWQRARCPSLTALRFSLPLCTLHICGHRSSPQPDPRLSPTPPFTHPFAQVVGDNTPAIQTVLACDVERTRLLAEEAEIISQLGGGGAQDGSSGGGAGSGAAAAAAAAAGAAVRPFGWRAVELLLTRTTAVPSICYPGGH